MFVECSVIFQISMDAYWRGNMSFQYICVILVYLCICVISEHVCVCVCVCVCVYQCVCVSVCIRDIILKSVTGNFSQATLPCRMILRHNRRINQYLQRLLFYVTNSKLVNVFEPTMHS